MAFQTGFSNDDNIYDWNWKERVAPLSQEKFEVFDETLRDGIQNPSVTDPSIEDKIKLVHYMNDLGIQWVNVGLPGAGPRAVEDAVRLTKEITEHKLAIKPACAARTHPKDIEAVIEVSQRAGCPLEIYAFLGSSPIRLYTEGWDLNKLLELSGSAISKGVDAGLKVTFVTEDTTRSHPKILDPLFRNAIDKGAHRLCLSDTVGHATPDGLVNLLSWVKNLIDGMGTSVGIDWHGHNDRGLGLVNAIKAIEAGATRVHGCALGTGERVGNTAIDQLLINLKLLNEWDHDLSKLSLYCELASQAMRVPIPINYPVMGKDAFRTATGVHAAAIIKATKKGNAVLADQIYSGVPAQMFGKKQVIDIGHQSGLSNVKFWLEERKIEPTEELCQAIFKYAKETNRTLLESEVMAIVQSNV